MDYIFWFFATIISVFLLSASGTLLTERRLRAWGENNLFFSIMAAKLDHIFYGRIPLSNGLPAWFIFTRHK